MSKSKASNRPKRRGLRRRGPLKTKQIPGFHLRWCNIHQSNIEELEELGYTPVTEEDMLEGDKSLTKAGTDKGSILQKHVGRGTEAILMKIPNDIYEEIQQEKIDESDERAEACVPREGQGYIRHDVET